jgi:hypothetical protein
MDRIEGTLTNVDGKIWDVLLAVTESENAYPAVRLTTREIPDGEYILEYCGTESFCGRVNVRGGSFRHTFTLDLQQLQPR